MYPGDQARGSQMLLVVKTPPANAGDTRDADSIPGLGRSLGGVHGNPLHYSCPRESPWTAEPGRLQSMGHKDLYTTAVT